MCTADIECDWQESLFAAIAQMNADRIGIHRGVAELRKKT